MTSEKSVARTIRIAISLAVLVALPVSAIVFIDNPLHARVCALAAVCLVLWLSEIVPLFVPTLVLWVGAAMLLRPFGPQYSLSTVLGWSASPILALFFGGFALCVAGEKYGIDRAISNTLVRFSRGKRLLLLLNVMAGTALLSMWMSNIAASAMMLGALASLLNKLPPGDGFRKALLLGVAFAADFGGMGTPVGTGPNAIALAVLEKIRPVSFLQWMIFAVPLTVVMVSVSFALLAVLYKVRGDYVSTADAAEPAEAIRLLPGGSGVVVIFLCAVAAWLTEPLHGIPAAAVALLSTVALFASARLAPDDLTKMDWNTVLLIAGGLALGEMLETSGLAHEVALGMPWNHLPPMLFLFLFVFLAAMLSAVASNTAAAALLIPIGLSLDTSHHFAILVALGTSMGVPFVISTPPNAMAYGKGGLRPLDLLIPGLILMLIGCVLLAVTGPWVLNFLLKGT